MRFARVSSVLVVTALAALALLVACSKQEPASTPPAASAAPAPAPASTGWTPESKPPQSLQVETSADVFNRQGVLKRVHFDTDKFDIRTEDRQILKDNAVWLLAHSQFKLIIEGHIQTRS